MRTYYNEFDKKKCAMLSQLMKDGLITKGDIDDRSIADVQADELKGYTRCHFFAGIGLWDYALQLAEWPEDREVWTGSCPCQPFSTAGRQKAKKDERHLWPEWERLIIERKPTTLFGEQVASAVSKGWLDDVYQGLEAQDYAIGAAVLPASACGAPHRRERLWFVGDSKHNGSYAAEVERGHGKTVQHNEKREDISFKLKGASNTCDVADTNSNGLCENGECITETRSDGIDGNSCAMGHANSEGLQRHRGSEQEQCEKRRQAEKRYPWKAGVWINCPDKKQRLIEPTIPLLAHGYTSRVPILHAIGDGIVPQVAAEFIKATM